MQQPRALSPGARIALFSPSGPCEHEKYDQGRRIVEDWGYQTITMPSALSRLDYLAGDDGSRLDDFQGALMDDSIDALWAIRGGYGASRLWPNLLEVAQALPTTKTPPWLIGFSDITVLHRLWQSRGWASLHAANITTLASWSEDGLARLQRFLSGSDISSEWSGQWWLTPDGDAAPQGRLVGGNLAVLASIVGAAGAQKPEGSILLIEDVGEAPYRLDRYLTQLRNAGWLDAIEGLVVGQLTQCGHDRQHQIDALLRVVETSPIAWVLGDVQIGHASTSLPILLGAEYRVDVSGASLKIIQG